MQALIQPLTANPLDVTNWWQHTASIRAQFSISIDRAIALGAHADRLGTAFLGGYTSAITQLDPTLGPNELGALCATESGGGHPRAILTTLENDRLSGTKQFVSGGPLATVLLVVAKVGEVDGRPDLKLARIDAKAAGVKFEEGLALDFVPEVPHGAVTFTDAKVERVLEGDGYEQYLKPFRTIEDLHVFGAVSACVIANGRTVMPQALTEQLLGLLAAIRQLGTENPRESVVHLAVAGVLGQARTIFDAIDFGVFAAEFGSRWLRDRRLLGVAGKVREQRRVRAWEGFTPHPDPLP